MEGLIVQSQSWQTDLLNLYFSSSLKPAMRWIKSIRLIRAITALSDATTGRAFIPFGTDRTPVAIPGAEFESEWVTPPDSEHERIILYLPGGAYIMRSPNMHCAMVSRLCAQANARALMAYYRLAPEHPFPACLEDSLLAYRWLLDQGYNPRHIVIAGDSAGGGLTLASLLAIRDRKLPLPACALMMSPVLDAGDMSASRWKNAYTDSLLPASSRRALNPRPLVIGEADIKDPLISPIYGDFTGLPPLYLQVSDSELLLDDSLRLARRGHQYQIEVSVELWRRVPHVWQAFPFLPESVDALRKAGAFVKKQIPDCELVYPVEAREEDRGIHHG
jgi:acetyl esterase/lipase